MRFLLPPCLLITAVQQPGTSSPPFRLKRYSTGVIWMCKASSTNNSVLCHGPLQWSPPSGLGGGAPTHVPLHLTSPSSPSRRHLGVPSASSPVSVWSLRCRLGRSSRGYDIPHWIVYPVAMYPSLWSTSNRESART